MSTENAKTLLDCAYHWEENTRDKVYLTQPLGKSGNGEVRDYTWGETMDEARRMANHLLGLGLPPKSHIALMGKNTAHWIMTDLAIMMADHISIPLYPTLSEGNIKQILEHSESKLLFVGKLDGWDAMKGGVPKNMPMISLPLAPPDCGMKWEQIVAETEPLQGNPRRETDELMTIVYTSGTTGTPKGVMLNFGPFVSALREYAVLLKPTGQDRMISYLPLAHVYERVAVLSQSMVSNIHLFFADSLETFVQDLQRARPTIFQSVPRLWVKFQAGVFAKMPREKLDRLLSIPLLSILIRKKVLKGLGLDKVRFAISAAAPLPAEVVAWYRKLGVEMSEAYGMSENQGYSHMGRPGRVKVGTVGEAAPGVEAKIDDITGEVLVKSPGQMAGYYKEPGLTKEALTADGFLCTGDMGEIDADGYLTITGRVKELFKTSKGKYIAPAPIENHLMNHPDVEQACVTGPGFPQPFALVMLSEEARAKLSKQVQGVREQIQKSLEGLLTEVNSNLEHHEQMQFLAVVADEWTFGNDLITPTMKIKRAAIEKKYGPHYQPWHDSQASVVWETA